MDPQFRGMLIVGLTILSTILGMGALIVMASQAGWMVATALCVAMVSALVAFYLYLTFDR